MPQFNQVQAHRVHYTVHTGGPSPTLGYASNSCNSKVQQSPNTRSKYVQMLEQLKSTAEDPISLIDARKILLQTFQNNTSDRRLHALDSRTISDSVCLRGISDMAQASTIKYLAIRIICHSWPCSDGTTSPLEAIVSP